MTTQNPAPRFVTLAEAAEVLGVSVRTIQRRIAAGELMAERQGERVARVRIDPVPPPTDHGAAVIVRETLTGVLDRYRASLDRMERRGRRLVTLAAAGLAVAVGGVAFAVAMSSAASKADANASSSLAEVRQANAALLASERQIADLRERLAETTAAVARVTIESRQRLAQMTAADAECERLTAERDELAEDLADIRVAFVMSPMASASAD
jgi:excisionase family DNA binding protein